MSFSYDQVVHVNCEWDIGLDDAVFEDEATARAWVDEALKNLDFEETLEELEGNGLIGFQHVSLISGN